MTRTDLQQLALLRLKDAEALLAAGQWDGAYYLAGYAVECALKACIAKLTIAEEFHDLQRAKDSWVHNYAQLLKAAKLANAHSLEIKTNVAFAASWYVAGEWYEGCRYETGCTEQTARELVAAIGDQAAGVLQWLQLHW